MYSAPPPRSSRTVLWGTLFGLILAALVVVQRLFEARLARAAGLGAPRPALALLSPVVLFVVGLICFFCAGLLAARRTRQLSSGVLAGLIAGSIAGVVGLVLALHSASVAEQVLRHAAVGQRVRTAAQAGIAGAVIRAVVGTITTAIVGIGMGALGGLAGRGGSGASATAGAPHDAAAYGAMTGQHAPTAGSPYAAVTPSLAPATSTEQSGPWPYGPVTPQTYIQGNDNPTIQSLGPE